MIKAKLKFKLILSSYCFSALKKLFIINSRAIFVPKGLFCTADSMERASEVLKGELSAMESAKSLQTKADC